MKPTFSVCIPNYNYEKYINLTLESVLEQTEQNFKVVISDNASTDNSIDVIKHYAEKDTRISFKVNRTNLGFAGNLDESAKMAISPWLIMLSSDDLITNTALQEYKKFIQLIPPQEQFSFTSSFEKIDSSGNFIEYLKPSAKIWYEKDIDKELSISMGYNVYKVNAGEMLKRCLTTFYNPYNFAATCYSKESYYQAGGYGGGRIYNPDKWFHWKLLSITNNTYFLDKPLFKYRWHQTNQQALEKDSDILKYWYDEYRNSFEVDSNMLEKSQMTKADVIQHYCTHLIKYIYLAIKNKDRKLAIRLFNWGKACYPRPFSQTKYYFILRCLLYLIPISSILLRLVKSKKMN